jgi:subfamily B ATP-binding cassette protein MsbA
MSNTIAAPIPAVRETVATSARRPDSNWWVLTPLVRDHGRLLAATLVLTALNAALEGVGIGLLIPFLDGVLNPGAPAFTTGWAWLDRAALGTDLPPDARLFRVGALILGSIWLRAVVSYVGNAASVRMTEGFIDGVRRRLVDQIHALSLQFFSKARAGDLLNTLTTETSRLQVLLGVARMFLVNGVMITTYVVVILLISWPLALVTLVLCGGLIAFLTSLLKKLRDNGRMIAEARGSLSAVAAELIGGIRTVTEFGAQPYESAKFAAVSEQSRRENIRAFVRSGAVGPLSQAIAATILVGLVIMAVKTLVAPGVMTASALLAFLVVLMRMLPLIQGANTSRAEWAVYRGSLDRVADLLRPDDKPFLYSGDRRLEGFTDSIVFDDVSFGYEPGQSVLKNVSLKINRGEIVALVGGSGSGKSTLVDLLARFYDPVDGRITLDGHDLRDYYLPDLRRQIAVVNQHTFLFNDSVRRNIAYGRDDISDERIREAAREAGALGFIEELPQGLDTLLGERGARLSGGQRQRIAIARALLRDPDVLILDEATSALDSVSERLVQESLERLMVGRTVVIIAHRLSTVEGADRVVVIEEGAVREEGSYRDLLATKGRLWEYHSLQFETAS